MYNEDMTEQWKDIVGYQGLYKISDLGNVWSERRQRLLSTKPNKHRGYPEFCVVNLDGKQRTMSVHQEVMKAFVGPLSPGHQVRHLDGNPLNNDLSNLTYGTPKENQSDRRKDGYQGPRLLSAEQIEEIRHKAKMGISSGQLAKEYEVSTIAHWLDAKTSETRRDLMVKCIKAGCGVEITGEYFGVTHAAITHSIKRYHGGVRQLRKNYPINASLTIKDIPGIIGLK
jgi:hypothetical protein